jgi:glycosyltransferase involved in cell wall biosynthesis
MSRVMSASASARLVGLPRGLASQTEPTGVLMLTNAITPDRMGGLERYVRELSDALARAGADVVVVTRRVSPHHPSREQTADGVRVVRYPTPAKSNPAYALGYPAAALKATLGSIRGASGTRVVHSHFPLQGLGAAAAGEPYVHTFHAPVHREVVPEHQGSYLLPFGLRGALRYSVRTIERVVVKRPAALVTLSRFMAGQAALLGAEHENMIQIAGGIDTRRFAPGDAIDPSAMPPGPGPLLFTARRLVPRTGVLELVRAMGDVSREVRGTRLAIAGGGPLEAEIRREISAMGVGDQVTLLGWVSDEDLVRWLRAADLVVVPTQELEGFGLATAEALACGTPVVGTHAGATPELLERLDPSLLARDTSPAAIATAVITQLREPTRLRRLAERARGLVEPSMSWTHIADAHLELYARVVAASAGQ